MTIQELKTHFKHELSALYSASETEELFFIFSEEILKKNKFEIRNSWLSIPDMELTKRLHHVVEELKTGKPYQQIIGEIEFYGMRFLVTENTLIPRPETEELLELTIEKLKEPRTKSQEPRKILDIGTGSGIISIVLKKYFPEAQVSAIDISEKALEVAKKNAEFHQVKINFIQKDFLTENLEEVYDIIISNPPYIGIEEEVEIANSVKEFEPKIALFSPTSDPLIFYKKIAKDAEKHLAENGMIFLETNQKLGKETLELFEKFTESKLLKDLSGNDRIVFAKK